MEEYKIPVITGINDIPLPPNYNGNGKSCNGAYYIEKFNNLVDLLSVALQYSNPLEAVLTHNLLNNTPFLIEIGEDFLGENESLELTYVLNISLFNPTAMVYGGEDLEDLAPLSPLFAPGDIWEYVPTQYSILPNSSQVKKTWYLRFQGQNEKDLEFISNFIEIRWVPMGYIGQSADADLQVNYLDNLSPLNTYLQAPEEFNKAASDDPEYVYILWPVNSTEEFPTLSGTVDGDNLFPIPLVSMGQKAITKANYEWTYDVYRTSLPTNGEYKIKFIME